MSIASILATGCCCEKSDEGKAPAPLTIDNALTDTEKAEGKFTAEVMWKMARIGAQTLSADGSKLLYAVTQYNLAENRGVSQLWIKDMATGEERALTDYSSTNHSAQWVDENTIAFMSNRSGSSQVWLMDADGSNVRQATNFDNDVEGFGIAGDKAFYVQRVKVAPLKGSDQYADMDKSKVRIYDDLMVRHWDYWDDGTYLHIFAAEYADGKIAEGVDIIGAESAWDAPLAPYFDCAEIRLSPDGQQLAYTCKPLTGTEYALSTDSDIFLYDFATKSTRNLSKEAATEEERFVGYDKYPVFSPDGKKIAWRSQRRPGNEADQQRLWVFDLGLHHTSTARRYVFRLMVSNSHTPASLSQAPSMHSQQTLISSSMTSRQRAHVTSRRRLQQRRRGLSAMTSIPYSHPMARRLRGARSVALATRQTSSVCGYLTLRQTVQNISLATTTSVLQRLYGMATRLCTSYCPGVLHTR